MAQWHTATVTRRIDWNSHLFTLVFRCPEFRGFVAGQFAKLGVRTEDGKVLSRPYSLVNAPDSEELEVLAVPVEDGQLSPQLQLLNDGDALEVMAPATGFLTLEEVPQADTLWMLATGTGVGPFISILRDNQVWRQYTNVVLVYAARKAEDLAYPELINQTLADHSDQFHFVPIVSRETPEGVLNGRIPTLLAEDAIQQQVGLTVDAESSQVMLCGNPDMIQDTMVVLENMGLKKHLRRSPGQISMERYW